MFKIKVVYRDSSNKIQQELHLEAFQVEVDYRLKRVMRHFKSSVDLAPCEAPIQAEEGVSIYIDGECVNFEQSRVPHGWDKAETLPGELDQPHTLANTDDRYNCVCVSTAHLTPHDREAALPILAAETNMVAERDTGFFVKLYEDADYYDPEAPGAEYNKFRILSQQALTILRDAHSAGYRMVEFDADADVYSVYPEFDS